MINKDIKHNWLQHWALGNPTSDWPPTACNSIHQLWACPSSQFSTQQCRHPIHEQLVSSGKCCGKLSKPLLLSRWTHLQTFPHPPTNKHLAIEAELIGQAGPVFYESMQPYPDPLVVLHVPCGGTQGGLFLPCHTDRPVIYQTVHPALPVDQYHIC